MFHTACFLWGKAFPFTQTEKLGVIQGERKSEIIKLKGAVKLLWNM